ncbi:hypothetical protein Hanom_Chr09g00771821 [Helianthus anomalus]
MKRPERFTDHWIIPEKCEAKHLRWPSRTRRSESIMEPYHRYLHTYVSVSGPHLGYLYSSNSLFNSGLWLLKKLKNTRCIHQPTFTDDIDLENTFFYNLSKQKTLESFKNIILLSSPQVYTSCHYLFSQATYTLPIRLSVYHVFLQVAISTHLRVYYLTWVMF